MTRERERIERIDVDQHRAERPTERRRQPQADDEADREHRCDAADDEADHVARRGAERAPHREVAQPLLHGVADDPEDADHRERQRQAGEGDDEHGAEPVALGRRPGDVLECPDVADADQLIAIDAPDRRPHR